MVAAGKTEEREEMDEESNLWPRDSVNVAPGTKAAAENPFDEVTARKREVYV